MPRTLATFPVLFGLFTTVSVFLLLLGLGPPLAQGIPELGQSFEEWGRGDGLFAELSRGLGEAGHFSEGLGRACTVTMDGVAMKACTCLAAQADGSSITTIEGLSGNGDLHPLQEAFWNKHGLQCGFCTPGMILAANELLRVNPSPSAAEIRHGLEGNFCRCTGYTNIVRAVQEAATVMGG